MKKEIKEWEWARVSNTSYENINDYSQEELKRPDGYTLVKVMVQADGRYTSFWKRPKN